MIPGYLFDAYCKAFLGLILLLPSKLPDKRDEDTGGVIFDRRIFPAFSVLKKLLGIEISDGYYDEATLSKLFYQRRRDLR